MRSWFAIKQTELDGSEAERGQGQGERKSRIDKLEEAPESTRVEIESRRNRHFYFIIKSQTSEKSESGRNSANKQVEEEEKEQCGWQ